MRPTPTAFAACPQDRNSISFGRIRPTGGRRFTRLIRGTCRRRRRWQHSLTATPRSSATVRASCRQTANSQFSWVIIATARRDSFHSPTTPSNLPLPPDFASAALTSSDSVTGHPAAARFIAAASFPDCMTCAWCSRRRNFPRRPRGTSSRSLSAWQATAQLVPLVLCPCASDIWPSCFAVRLPACPSPFKPQLPCFTPPAKSQNRPELSLWRLCEARGFWLVFLTWRDFLRTDAAEVSP